MKIVVKLGGTLLDDLTTQHALVSQLHAAASEHQIVIVHGGGKQVTRSLEERGIASHFVGGLRVSDEHVIDAVLQMIAGRVNKRLVAAFIAVGRNAVGISGVDGLLTTAVQWNAELGFVGKPQKTDATLLNLVFNAGYLPLVACIAGNTTGQIFNVNADQMAVSCAAGWGADRLLFLTDVPGVKGSTGQLIKNLTAQNCYDLIEAGVAHGGMQAKLESAVAALQQGIGEVCIASGRESDVVARSFHETGVGTRVSLAEVIQ